MFYTREQIARLEKYRKNFETAVNSGFARNVGSIALKEIEQVYDEAFKSHYSYNSGCSVCVLSFLKRAGKPFLEESAIYAAQDKEAQEETPDVHMKDGVITFNFDRALKEEKALAAKPKRTPRKKKEETQKMKQK